MKFRQLFPLRKTLASLLALSALVSASAQSAGMNVQFSPPSGWVISQDLDNVKAWKDNTDQVGFISIVEDRAMKGAAGVDPDDKAFIEKSITGASLPNWIAGIHNYKINKLEREKLSSGGLKVVMFGTYVDYDNRTIQFEEWKFYTSKGYGQIEYSEFASPKARDRDAVRKILERYNPLGS